MLPDIVTYMYEEANIAYYKHWAWMDDSNVMFLDQNLLIITAIHGIFSILIDLKLLAGVTMFSC